ncbi:hypothetical protein PG985_006354 [Apiospora marii]|uniref:uncharacterized protein n=1 Tax=Apiospora marii TaxID=335849 RepID=UPI0031328A7C
MTNLGLSVHLPLVPREYSALSHLSQGFLKTEIEVVSAILNCGRSSTDLAVIRLLRVKPRGLVGSAGSRIYHRLGMSSLDFFDTSKKHSASRSDIFIAKKLQIGAHHAPFDHGGIHLQNLPLTTELGAKGTADPVYGYIVKSVVGPWLFHPSPQRKISWSSLYGCVFFQTSDLGLYNDPLHINFESPLRAPFYLSVGYSDNWVQLSAALGSTPELPGPVRDSDHDTTASGDGRLRHGFAAPRGSSYERGEAAGNRPHFLVFVAISSPAPSPRPQITNAVYVSEPQQIPVQVPAQFRNPDMNKRGLKYMFGFKRNDSAPY